MTRRHSAISSLRASATIIVVLRAPLGPSVRVRYQRASALSFWNIRKRHANWISPRRTRALPALARPFSRRFKPLSELARQVVLAAIEGRSRHRIRHHRRWPVAFARPVRPGPAATRRCQNSPHRIGAARRGVAVLPRLNLPAARAPAVPPGCTEGARRASQISLAAPHPARIASAARPSGSQIRLSNVDIRDAHQRLVSIGDARDAGLWNCASRTSLPGDRDPAPDIGPVVTHVDPDGAQHRREPVQFVRQNLRVRDLAHAAKEIEQFARGSFPLATLSH